MNGNMSGFPNLRSGVDITVKPLRGAALRLLAVHLKSGCFQGTTASACPQLLQKIPVVAKWINDAAAGPTRFVDWAIGTGAWRCPAIASGRRSTTQTRRTLI